MTYQITYIAATKDDNDKDTIEVIRHPMTGYLSMYRNGGCIYQLDEKVLPKTIEQILTKGFRIKGIDTEEVLK